MTEETKAFVDRFTVADLVSAGSSLKFCRVACGEDGHYPRLGRHMECATAAADAMLRAAGGKVTHFGKSHAQSTSGGIARDGASVDPAADHEEVVGGI